MGIHSHDQDDSIMPQTSGLRLLKDCPVCQTNFQQSDIRVIDTYQNIHVLHVTCSSCIHSILSVCTVSPFGMSSVGMATDLSAIDAERILDTDPIHEDELLSFHAFLAGKSGEKRQIEDLFVTRATNV